MLRVFLQRSIRMSSPNQVRSASTAVFASKVRLNTGQLRHQLESPNSSHIPVWTQRPVSHQVNRVHKWQMEFRRIKRDLRCFESE